MTASLVVPRGTLTTLRAVQVGRGIAGDQYLDQAAALTNHGE